MNNNKFYTCSRFVKRTQTQFEKLVHKYVYQNLVLIYVLNQNEGHLKIHSEKVFKNIHNIYSHLPITGQN